MIIYEVNIAVAKGIESDYRHWLRDHVAQILALPGFVSARIFDVVTPEAAKNESGICVQYELTDKPALDAYLAEHAPRMRADGVLRFGHGFRAERRVLQCTGG